MCILYVLLGFAWQHCYCSWFALNDRNAKCCVWFSCQSFCLVPPSRTTAKPNLSSLIVVLPNTVHKNILGNSVATARAHFEAEARAIFCVCQRYWIWCSSTIQAHMHMYVGCRNIIRVYLWHTVHVFAFFRLLLLLLLLLFISCSAHSSSNDPFECEILLYTILLEPFPIEII